MGAQFTENNEYILLFKGLGKKCMLLFSKDALNCSKVTVTSLIMLQTI